MKPDIKKIEKKFFNELAKVLEDLFPKGEKCKCRKKLPCRSRALVLNTYANILFKSFIKKVGAGKIEK